MVAGHRSLKEFPALASWYELHGKWTQKDRSLPEWVAIKTCAALDSDQNVYALKIWIGALLESFSSSQDLRRDFLEITTHFSDYNADFTEILGDLSHLAVQLNLGSGLLPVLQMGAARTHFSALRFLAAWTALNCNKPDICVEECDHVEEASAPIQALQGQAYLELGKPHEALEALNVATTLSPQDIVPWFQKAKALQVLGRSIDAFHALKVCENLAPGSNEIALFMAMIAGGLEENIAIKEHAWASLKPHLKDWGHIPNIPFALLRLAGLLNDREKALHVVSDFGPLIGLSSTEDFQDLSDILRLLQQREWMDIAAKLLQKTQTGTVSPQK